MKGEKIKCKICHKEFDYISGYFVRHLKKIHGKTAQEYYEEYLKHNQKEGLCVVCGKPTHFDNIKKGYRECCTKECAFKNPKRTERRINTCIQKYGVESTSALKSVQEKAYKTKCKNRPSDPTNREKNKQTCLKKYGVENISQLKEIKKKKENTFLNHYGIKNNFGNHNILFKAIQKLKSKETTKKRENTNLQKYGVAYPMQDKQKMQNAIPKMIKNIIKTKRKNGTFNTSMQEDKIYNILIETFGKKDIKRNYKSKEYPFLCDFYIKSKNLYIECNFHWTHGKHWFNKNNADDIHTLNLWKEKAKTSSYYKNAIDVWTSRDIIKQQVAGDNKLNYIVFWEVNDINIWLSLDCPNGKDWKYEYSWKVKSSSQ